eukprot:CAMPEP_0170597778 /NCGR_PEP_ID=MMETSP0224-20130122/15887_1 /TAXON_ID=285029 /ORGANISM="Togula jolla, Strain CCCM 725" /LENGTH=495 /DNA_ID=CAMNT_0010922269 /DNA_START=33 /DNA_END=1518 /DNA_ORIENTATION=+
MAFVQGSSRETEYFELSPRPTRVPRRAVAPGAENLDANARNALAACHRGKATAPVHAAKLSGLIGHDPKPEGCRAGSRSATPRRAAEPVHPTARSLDCSFDESALTSVSIHSEVSVASRMSRLSQLSQRSSMKRHLSSQEIEQLKVEQKKQEVRDMMRRNSVNCRRAITGADVPHCAGRARHSLAVTVPKEFSLSAPPTPRGGFRSLNASVNASVNTSVNASINASVNASMNESVNLEEPRWSTSLRRSASSRSTTDCASSSMRRVPSQQWKPKLTVPQGPELRTTRRSSSCGTRRSSSVDPDSLPDKQPSVSSSQARTPRKPQEAAIDASTARKMKAEERAQRARVQVQQQKDEEAALAMQKWSGVFKSPRAVQGMMGRQGEPESHPESILTAQPRLGQRQLGPAPCSVVPALDRQQSVLAAGEACHEDFCNFYALIAFTCRSKPAPPTPCVLVCSVDFCFNSSGHAGGFQPLQTHCMSCREMNLKALPYIPNT